MTAERPSSPAQSPEEKAPPNDGHALVGESRRPPRAAFWTFILSVTGLLALGHLLALLGRLTLGIKRPATIEVTPQGIRVEQRTLFLGRVIRDRQTLVPLEALLRVTREVRFARVGLYAGLITLALGTYFGVRLFIDGLRAPGGSSSLLFYGLVVMLVGLLLDFALSSVSDTARGRCQITVVPVKGKAVCVGALDADRADATLEAVAAELGIRPKSPNETSPLLQNLGEVARRAVKRVSEERSRRDKTAAAENSSTAERDAADRPSGSTADKSSDTADKSDKPSDTAGSASSDAKPSDTAGTSSDAKPSSSSDEPSATSGSSDSDKPSDTADKPSATSGSANNTDKPSAAADKPSSTSEKPSATAGSASDSDKPSSSTADKPGATADKPSATFVKPSGPATDKPKATKGNDQTVRASSAGAETGVASDMATSANAASEATKPLASPRDDSRTAPILEVQATPKSEDNSEKEPGKQAAKEETRSSPGKDK